MENPFHFGSPIDGADRDGLCDREEDLALLVEHMRSGRNVIVLAPRRYGKTSLLLRAVEDVRRSRGQTGWVSLSDCATERDVAEALLAGVLNGPARWGSRQQARVRDWLARHGVSVRLSLGAGGLPEVAVSLSAHDRPWRDTVREVMGLLRVVAERGGPVSLVVDEFQQAYAIEASLMGVFKRLTDELRDVSLVLSGSRRHLMQQLTSGPGAPLARVGTTLALERIAESAMVGFLVRRSAAAGKRLEAGVAAQIYRRSNGIPNETQQLAALAFDAAGAEVTGADVEAAEELLIDHARWEYVTILEHTSPAQRTLLKLMAEAGPLRGITSRDVVDRVQVANGSGVLKALRALERDDRVELVAEGWQISNPFFARWLRDRAARE